MRFLRIYNSGKENLRLNSCNEIEISANNDTDVAKHLDRNATHNQKSEKMNVQKGNDIDFSNQILKHNAL